MALERGQCQVALAILNTDLCQVRARGVRQPAGLQGLHGDLARHHLQR